VFAKGALKGDEKDAAKRVRVLGEVLDEEWDEGRDEAEHPSRARLFYPYMHAHPPRSRATFSRPWGRGAPQNGPGPGQPRPTLTR